MTNLRVDNGTGGDVVALANHITAILTEKSHVMAFLNRKKLRCKNQVESNLNADKSDSGVVGAVALELQAGLSHRLHLMGENELELTLANSITVHDNLNVIVRKIIKLEDEDPLAKDIFTYSLRLAGILAIEALQQVLDHVLGVGDELQATLLNGNGGLKRNFKTRSFTFR